MKLRLLGNSIRLRLTKTEVACIAEGLKVTECLSLSPTTHWNYSLASAAHVDAIEAQMSGSELLIRVPASSLTAWATGPEIALKADCPNGTESGLRILIEKDFQCLKPRENQQEDESDLFINPNEVHGQCGSPP